MQENCLAICERRFVKDCFRHKKSPDPKIKAFFKFPGNDLLSHEVTLEVSSALKGLTAVFGMGTGVSPSLLPPENMVIYSKIY